MGITRQRVGFILTVVAAFTFASKTILAKLAYRYGVDALTLLTLRMAFAGGIFALIMAYNLGRGTWSLKLSRSEWAWAFVLGIFGYYLSALLDFAGLVYVEASLGRMILFLYPTLVLLIESVLSRRPISSSTWLALILCYSGILMMMAPGLKGGSPNLWLGAGLIFSAAWAYAGYLVGVGRLMKSIDLMRFTSMVLCISCLSVVIHFLLVKDISILADLPTGVWINGALMGTLATVLPIYALTAGIERIGAAKSAMVSMIGPVITSLMGVVLLDESLGVLQLAGMFLVMVGVWRVGK